MFKQHIQMMEEKEIVVPDFDSNLNWFNSERLSFDKNLKGKIVVLDFWTYCCINCIHVLPDLKFLEEKYKDTPVVFIGVHSAKFDNEKDSENIKDAILRYEISHPVVNDPEMHLWTRLGVTSWPTFAVISPRGHIIYATSGEGKREILDTFIHSALQYYQSELNETPIAIKLEKKVKSTLSYPGKLAIDSINKRLFISDSNHHRIVITDLDGKIGDTISSSYPGLQDGDYQNCRFNRLQGLLYHQDLLFVADSENNALRCVDLKKKQVKTITEGLNTPWDLCLGDLCLGSDESIYIAMAGTHQIWKYDLKSNQASVFSGTGAEMNLNHRNKNSAAWAQPSGITASQNALYIADSESSSIRVIDLNSNATDTLVGGDSNHPQNLFHFGDQDGQAPHALLQHPLGVLWLENEKKVIVADTYNHRIKALDPLTKTIETWAGNGKPGFKDGQGIDAQFREPSGFALSPDQNTLYIADTNNHCIRLLNIKTKEVTTLNVN